MAATPADSIRNARLDELLGTRGPGPERAVRLRELDALVRGVVFDALTRPRTGTAIPVFSATSNGLVPASGGGTATFLRADGTWAAPAGVLSGTGHVVVPNNAMEASGTLAAPGVTAAHRVLLSIAPHDDSDENSADMLDLAGMSGRAGTGTISVTMAFSAPSAGPIKLNWIAHA
jgi:hypothetical protein